MLRITHLYHEIKPGGGPAGYLANLQQAAGKLAAARIV